jgi:hypothetical protein
MHDMEDEGTAVTQRGNALWLEMQELKHPTLQDFLDPRNEAYEITLSTYKVKLCVDGQVWIIFLFSC